MISRFLYQSIVWKGLVYFSSFILNILIARHFEAAISGNIYYLINAYSLVLLIVSMSLESGIVYFGVKKEIEMGKLVNFSLLYTAVVALVLGLIIFLFKNISFSGISRGLFIVSSLSFICGNLLISYGNSLFNAEKNFVWPNVVALFINVALSIILIIKWSSHNSHFTNDFYFYIYFLSFLFTGIVMAIIFYLFYLKKLRFLLPTAKEFKKIFNYCSLAWIANILFFLLYRMDYFFVEKYCTAQELGNYIQVSKIAQMFFLIPSIAAGVIFPLTASEGKESVFRWLAILSRIFLFFYAIICLVLIISGKWLFPLVFGNSFQSMYVAFVFLVPGILSLSVLYTLTAYNAGINKISINIASCVWTLLVILAGNILLIPWYSINNAAMVSSIGYISMLIYLMTVFKRKNQVKLSGFFLFRYEDIAALKKFIKNSKRDSNGIQQ
jgi:O-antigen/teichoic acid export membrane protein